MIRMRPLNPDFHGGTTLQYIDTYKYSIFKWLYGSNFIHKFLLALCIACLTGLGAQIKIHLPFTPVPITGQVFFVLLSGTLLGRYGGLSQALYLGIGCLGLPWFAGMRGGFEVIIGITGGYIIGFIIASTLIGFFTEGYLKARSLKFQLLLMLTGIGIIYAVGAMQFSLIMHTELQKTLILAVIPFIPLDIIKAFTASIISTAILPKKNYNGKKESEAHKGAVTSAMPGIIIKIKVKVGEKVEEGDTIAILESMKMENIIKSPLSGVVKRICVNEGDTVSHDDILMIIREM